MKAVRIVRPRETELYDAPMPEICDPYDVKIRVAYSGICPDEMPFFRKDVDMLAYGSLMFPLTGHEMSGVVVDAGDGARHDGFVPGTRVSGYAWNHCGRCYYCRTGRENLCMNLQPSQSTMAEYIVWRSRQLIIIPDSVSFKAASLTDPVGFSLHGISRSNLKQGDNVLILGGSAPGMILTQLAKQRGAINITLADPYEENRQRALSLGASHSIHPESDSFSSRALEITDNRGFDVAFETSGNLQMLSVASKLMARGGVLAYGCVYGLNKQPPINIAELFIKEVSLTPFHMAPYMLPRVQGLLEHLELEALISRVYSMDEATQAYKDCESGRFPHVVVEIHPE